MPARRPRGAVAASVPLGHFAWERLTAGVHRCRLPFCDVTIGLVGGRTGALLVDTGTTLAEAAAIDADARRIAGRPVTHVVFTHKHFDHVLGSSMFAEADVYCAPEVAEYLSSETDQLRADALSYGADAAEVDRAIAALRPPRHGIYGAVIDLGDRAVTIAHPGRGHTTSDLVVVVHPGRAQAGWWCSPVISSRNPPTPRSTPIPMWRPGRQRWTGYSRSVGPQAIYVPGHGKVVDAEFIRRQRDWLSARGMRRSGHPGR